YFQMGNPKDYPLLLKVGRQEMTYGDERFVGVSDWNNAGRSFDAVKLRFENETIWMDAFVSRPVVIYDEHFNQSNDYETFSGLYASSRKLVPVQDTELFFFSRNAKPEAVSSSALLIPGTPTTARDTYTIGGRVKSLPGKLNGWDYRSEVAGQFGSVSQGGERRELDAFIGDAMIGYTWTNVWAMPRLAAEYTYASGDHDFTDNK